jgi:hypothetical protein
MEKEALNSSSEFIFPHPFGEVWLGGDRWLLVQKPSSSLSSPVPDLLQSGGLNATVSMQSIDWREFTYPVSNITSPDPLDDVVLSPSHTLVEEQQGVSSFWTRRNQFWVVVNRRRVIPH